MYIYMHGKILSLPLKPVKTHGKSSVSAVWQGFEFTFVLVIFAKLFPISLLNLISMFHHISELCMVKSMWPYVRHICLITKIIIVFHNQVFLPAMLVLLYCSNYWHLWVVMSISLDVMLGTLKLIYNINLCITSSSF